MHRVVAIALLIVSYNLFFFPFYLPTPGRIDFFLYQGITLLALWLLYKPRWSRQVKYAAVTTLVALIGSGLALFMANPVSQQWLGYVSTFLTLATLYLLLLKDSPFGSLSELVVIPFRIFNAWQQRFFRQGHEWGKLVGNVSLGDTALKVIRGAVISVPLLLITLGLLASADPIFGKLLSTVFQFPHDVVGRILYSGLLLVGLVPLSVTTISNVYVSPTTDSRWGRYTVEMMTVVGLLALILGVFLVIQFRYLFASVPENELYQFGINTYSEYVRRGFVEMIFVTGIAYGVAALGYIVTRSSGLANLRVLNLVLLAEVGLFIMSIFRRLYLYQLHHGLTRIRIFGSVIVMYLLSLVVLLGLRYLYKGKRPWYMYEVGMGIVLVVVTALIQPDALVARWFPPTVNQEIDYVYLSRLSAEALPGWIEGYKHAQAVRAEALEWTATPSADAVRPLIYADATVAQLIDNYTGLAYRYGSREQYEKLLGRFEPDAYKNKRWGWHWLEMNVAERQGYLTLQEEIHPDELKNVKVDLEKLLESLPPELRYMPLDRSYNSPLL